jgi:small-conductance mechanosensitive channel
VGFRRLAVQEGVVDEHVCSIGIRIDHIIPPADVIAMLQAAASGSSGIVAGNAPSANACRFTDSFIEYELTFLIEDYTRAAGVQSEVIRRVADRFRSAGIGIGTADVSVPVLRQG